MIMQPFERENLERLIQLAIDEDIAGGGDLATEALISEKQMAKAELHVKEDGVISGIEVAEMVMDHFGSNAFTALVKDGDFVKAGQRIIEIEAHYDILLTAERTMLNFLQRMSGIATMTHEVVQRLDGTNSKLLDTRKTVPGHRYTDKLAVFHGGGCNHRMGLYDMAMLKDNHIKVAGGVKAALDQVHKHLPISIKVEVETKNLDEVREAIEGHADIIMLDNMSCAEMTEAVKLIDGRAITEASGNITINTAHEVACTGVDYMSMGALTHTVKALDISMNFIDVYNRNETRDNA